MQKQYVWKTFKAIKLDDILVDVAAGPDLAGGWPGAKLGGH